MGRHRIFDHDLCRAMYASGRYTYAALAEHFGVSGQSIARAVNPDVAAYQRDWQMRNRVPCAECGALCYGRYRPGRLCVACAARAHATTATADALQCSKCREWKPDEAYPRNRTAKIGRRGRHGVCRPCQTEMKREYRAAHLEAARSYDREYQRRRRAGVAA